MGPLRYLSFVLLTYQLGIRVGCCGTGGNPILKRLKQLQRLHVDLLSISLRLYSCGPRSVDTSILLKLALNAIKLIMLTVGTMVRLN